MCAAISHHAVNLLSIVEQGLTGRLFDGGDAAVEFLLQGDDNEFFTSSLCPTCIRLDQARDEYDAEIPEDMQPHIWDHGCRVKMLHSSQTLSCEFFVDASSIGTIELRPAIAWHSEQIDMDRLRMWLTHCDNNDGTRCQPSRDIIAPAHLMLIDVVQHCLVTTMLPATYAALSYVWGQANASLATTTRNIDDLRMHRSLLRPVFRDQLPATIRDAIELAAKIGIPYLWVDRLCIIQDDSENKAFHIQSMSSIYHHAYLTIIAADGLDAEHGIRGIGDLSRPRNSDFLKSRLFEFSPSCKLATADDSWIAFEGERGSHNDAGVCWATRGWTYQERILSRRCVVFCRGTVFWECASCVAFEDVISDANGMLDSTRGHPYTPSPLGSRSWPDLEAYGKLVSEYNEKLLTYEAGALDAFTAILNVLSAKFVDGFFWGMPEAFFDIALLWLPADGQLRRRTVRDASNGNYLFPSWSWIGWAGAIDMSSARNYSYLGDYLEHTTFPILRWYKSDTRTGQQIPVSNCYNQYRMAGSMPDHSHMQGWFRTQRLQPIWPRAHLPKAIFRHQDDPQQEFVHPVPIRHEKYIPGPHHWGPLLRFRTQMARFWSATIKDNMTDEDDDEDPNVFVHLYNSSRERVGLLNPNTRAPDQEVNLIAISEGASWPYETGAFWFRPELDFDFRKRRTQDSLRVADCYQYYNVLWVAWEDGIAYRKGVGRVWKPMWEEADLIETDVVLG